MSCLLRLCVSSLLLLCAVICAHAQDSFNNCPMVGTALGEAHQEINREKNRYQPPTQAEIDAAVTLAKLVAPGNDRTRFRVNQAATITGYVANVYVGGDNESCNCGSHTPTYRDTHIELALSASDSAPNRRVIVEVTPRLRAAMKKQGVDWSTKNLQAQINHQQVRITGWLFFDYDHAGESQNTLDKHTKPKDIWRATAWEIHPITQLEVRKGNKWVTVDKL